MPKRRPQQLEFIFGRAPTPATTRHAIAFGAQSVTYTLKRSPRRRSITFTIDEQGLHVGAPWRASQRHVENLLNRNAAWVTHKLAEWQQRKALSPRWGAGAMLMLKGKPLTLGFAPNQTTTLAVDGNLWLALDATAGGEKVRAHVIDWLRAKAHAWFEERVAHFAPLLGVPPPKVRLSNARTRWGSCSPDGRVRLNWRLIQMPNELIDYVAVHELAHLRELNHSRRFWDWVATVLPDHAERRCALRREGGRYLIV